MLLSGFDKSIKSFDSYILVGEELFFDFGLDSASLFAALGCLLIHSSDSFGNVCNCSYWCVGGHSHMGWDVHVARGTKRECRTFAKQCLLELEVRREIHQDLKGEVTITQSGKSEMNPDRSHSPK